MFYFLSTGDGSVGGVEHSDASGVELNNEAFLWVDSGAIAGELLAVEDKVYSMAKLDAKFSPLFYYFFIFFLCNDEPMVQ